MSKEDYVVFTCCHCDKPFIIYKNEFNCCILRHGVYKNTMKHINPHASLEECQRLVAENKIYGCGKPLQIVKKDKEFIVEKCDYI